MIMIEEALFLLNPGYLLPLLFLFIFRSIFDSTSVHSNLLQTCLLILCIAVGVYFPR